MACLLLRAEGEILMTQSQPHLLKHWVLEGRREKNAHPAITIAFPGLELELGMLSHSRGKKNDLGRVDSWLWSSHDWSFCCCLFREGSLSERKKEGSKKCRVKKRLEKEKHISLRRWQTWIRWRWRKKRRGEKVTTNKQPTLLQQLALSGYNSFFSRFLFTWCQ